MRARSHQHVAFVGGATAGHLAPAVATAEALLEARPAASVSFFVARSSPGAWVVEDAGFEIDAIDARPFYGSSWTERAGLALRVAGVALAARRQLARRGAGVVAAFGGFGSADVALAAASLGIPVLVHEANARAGISTRLAARLAARVLLGEEEARPEFPRARVAVTGTPVRRELAVLATRLAAHPATRLAARPATRLAARPAAHGTDAGRPLRILVCGGSLGSDFFDRRLPATLALARRGGLAFDVTHLARDAGRVQDEYRRCGIDADVPRERRRMGEALAAADFVVSRAGASSLAELAITATPSLLVPLAGHARSHQSANLVAASRRAPLWWIEERHWRDEEVAAALAARLGDGLWLAGAASAMRTLARPDAAEAAAGEILRLLDRRRA